MAKEVSKEERPSTPELRIFPPQEEGKEKTNDQFIPPDRNGSSKQSLEELPNRRESKESEAGYLCEEKSFTDLSRENFKVLGRKACCLVH